MESQRTAAPVEPSDRSAVPGNGHAATAHASTSGETPPPDAFKHAAARFGELKEYVAHFLGAKVDGYKVTLRKIAIFAVVGLVAGIIGLGIILTAAVLLLSGLAGAVGTIFEPDRPWAGSLIVGFAVVAGLLFGVYFAMKRITGSSRKRTIEKYENRKRDQHSRFGASVQERAREHVGQQTRA